MPGRRELPYLILTVKRRKIRQRRADSDTETITAALRNKLMFKTNYRSIYRSVVIAAVLIVYLTGAFSVPAQSGGTFSVEKSAIAAGGGTSAGGAFTVEGTAGQVAAGGILQSATHRLQGGFWVSEFVPTAASVTVSGRVFTPSGNGLVNAVVTMTDTQGNARTVRTTTFGYFRFEAVEAGEVYIFGVKSKRYRFTPQVLSVFDDVRELNFTPENWD
jgi:hypothetical protein